MEQSSPRGRYLIRNYNKQTYAKESTIEVSNTFKGKYIQIYRVTKRLQSEPVSLTVGGRPIQDLQTHKPEVPIVTTSNTLSQRLSDLGYL